MSDLSLEAASGDGVLPESDPTLFAMTIAVLVIAATGLVVATGGRLGLAAGSSSADITADDAIAAGEQL